MEDNSPIPIDSVVRSQRLARVLSETVIQLFDEGYNTQEVALELSHRLFELQKVIRAAAIRGADAAP